MAFPSIRDAATTLNNVSSATPAVNYPANVVAGDTLICFAGSNAAPFTFPAGWTELRDITNIDELAVAWRKADGSEGGGTFIVSHTAVKSEFIVYSIQDAADPTVGPPRASGVASGSSANPDPPSNTASFAADDYLWLVAAECQGVGTVSAYPTGFTLSQQAVVSSGGSGGSNLGLAAAGRQLNADNTFDPDPFTFTASDSWLAVSISVRPGAAAQPLDSFGPVDRQYWHPSFGPFG